MWQLCPPHTGSKSVGKKTKDQKDQQVTLVTFLLDRTGSMGIIKNDTIGGFNTCTGELKASDTPIEFSLIQFSSEGFQTVCVAAPIKTVPELSDENYKPSGGTPLIEAAYKTIQAVAASLSKRTDKPKVIVCIQTDGEENSSDQSVPSDEIDEQTKQPIPLYSWRMLKKLVAAKTAEGWQFNFLGSGIDAYQQATSMGISAHATMAAGMDAASTRASYQGMAASTVRYASGKSADTSFFASEAQAAGDVYRNRYIDPQNPGTVVVTPTPVAPPISQAPTVISTGTIRTPLVLDPGGGSGGAPPQAPYGALHPPGAHRPLGSVVSSRSGLGGLDL